MNFGPPEPPRSRIAILGWGSLLWDESPRFDAQHGPWEPDGPELPLEFSRVSGRRLGALTLVLDAANGAPCRVSYTMSRRPDPDLAVADLRDREGTNHANIGFLVLSENRYRARDSASLKAIRAWAAAKELDAAVWTDLDCNFEEQVGEPFSIPSALGYVESRSGDSRAKAIEYLRRAPALVDTAFRRAAAARDWYRG